VEAGAHGPAFGAIGLEPGRLHLLTPRDAALLVSRLRDTPLFVPHERVARIAREMGFTAVEVAGPGDAQMLARLLAYFGGAK